MLDAQQRTWSKWMPGCRMDRLIWQGTRVA
jgi:hypothetical protein